MTTKREWIYIQRYENESHEESLEMLFLTTAELQSLLDAESLRALPVEQQEGDRLIQQDATILIEEDELTGIEHVDIGFLDTGKFLLFQVTPEGLKHMILKSVESTWVEQIKHTKRMYSVIESISTKGAKHDKRRPA